MSTGIYKRGKTWYIRFQENGKLKRKAISHNKDDAIAVAEQIDAGRAFARAARQEWTGLAEIEKAREMKTFAEAADDYMAGMPKPKASTVGCYRSILNCHLLPAFGPIPVKEIKPADIRRLQTKLAVGRSACRVNTIISLLGTILKQCVVDEVIVRNPIQAVRRLKEERPDVDPFSEEELAAIFAVIDPHYRPLFQCLVYTGARPNELQALRWTDINWINLTISINKGRVRGIEGPPKTPGSKRKIPITPPVEAALNELKARKTVSAGGYVFVNKKGQPIDKHLDRVWNKAEKKAGVNHRRGYQLRHTHATNLISQGFPPNQIARWLGHSVETLYRCYASHIEAQSTGYDQKLRDSYKKEGSQEDKRAL